MIVRSSVGRIWGGGVPERLVLYRPQNVETEVSCCCYSRDDRPFPPPPDLNVEISSYRSGEATQLCAGEGGGIISSSYMISSVWEWSTDFVVRVLFATIDYKAAFQLILTRIVGLLMIWDWVKSVTHGVCVLISGSVYSLLWDHSDVPGLFWRVFQLLNCLRAPEEQATHSTQLYLVVRS